MYERLLDKSVTPDEAAIQKHLGDESYKRLADLENRLYERYQLSRELRFPFGNSYGWGYKYSHKSSHLCYAFFEKGAFTIMLQTVTSRLPYWKANYRHYCKRHRIYGGTAILAVSLAVGFITGF